MQQPDNWVNQMITRQGGVGDGNKAFYWFIGGPWFCGRLSFDQTGAVEDILLLGKDENCKTL